MVISKKWTTKALIRLRGCAGWSAPVLLTNPEDRFSRDEAQIYLCCNVSSGTMPTLCLFLAVSWLGLLPVVVIFPGHIHSLFETIIIVDDNTNILH